MPNKIMIQKKIEGEERSRHVTSLRISDFSSLSSLTKKVYSISGSGTYTFQVSYGGNGHGFETVWQGRIWKNPAGKVVWEEKNNDLETHTGIKTSKKRVKART